MGIVWILLSMNRGKKRISKRDRIEEIFQKQGALFSYSGVNWLVGTLQKGLCGVLWGHLRRWRALWPNFAKFPETQMHLKSSASTLSLSPRPHGPSLLPTHDQVLLIFQGLAQTCLPLCFLSWLSAGLYYWLVCSCCAVLSCSVVSDPYNSVDCSLTGSSVHGILQARILEWVAMPSSRESSQAAVINTRLCGLDHTRWFSHSSGAWNPRCRS